MLAGHERRVVSGAVGVSVRALALALALLLTVPAAVAIAVSARRSARAASGGSIAARRLDLLYAAAPLALLGALIALAWTAA